MKQITCEMCGSTDLAQENGFVVCQSCGMKYSVEEAKKLMIEGTVEVQGTVKIDKSNETDNLIKRLFILLEDGDWDSASGVCDEILKIDPENAKAYLGKLMIDLHVSKQENIKSCYEDFSQNNNFQRAVRYADDQLKTTLNTYVKYYNEMMAPKIKLLEPFEWERDKNNGVIIRNIKDRNITTLQIPQGVTEILFGAFQFCSSIQELIIPDSVTWIGHNAFCCCSGLTKVTLSNRLTEISQNTFTNCDSLTSITIPDSVLKIGAEAFKGCGSLRSVSIGKNVTSIGSEAFRGCKSLQAITIPDSVKHLCREAFIGCSSLSQVTLGNGLTDINSSVFQACKNLTSIRIPPNINEIGYKAFAYSGLKTIYVSSSVKIDSNAFDDCGTVTKLSPQSNTSSVGNMSHSTPNYTPSSAKPTTNGVGANSQTTPTKQGSSNGGCYIATCVYGSYNCPQVWTLRRFRDDTLGATGYGKLFIRTYYAISPTLVKWFGHTNWFKKLWKRKLDRMVAKLQSNGVEDTPYEDKNWQKSK